MTKESPTTTVPIKYPFFTFNNTDWSGNDLLSAKASDVNACGTLCDKTSGCQFFTYGADGNCYMKKFGDARGTFSVRRPDGTYMSILKSDIPGSDVNYAKSASMEACNILCSSDKLCTATSFYDGNCYMKGPKDSDGSISGWIDR